MKNAIKRGKLKLQHFNEVIVSCDIVFHFHKITNVLNNQGLLYFDTCFNIKRDKIILIIL